MKGRGFIFLKVAYDSPIRTGISVLSGRSLYADDPEGYTEGPHLDGLPDRLSPVPEISAGHALVQHRRVRLRQPPGIPFQPFVIEDLEERGLRKEQSVILLEYFLIRQFLARNMDLRPAYIPDGSQFLQPGMIQPHGIRQGKGDAPFITGLFAIASLGMLGDYPVDPVQL